MSFQAGYLHAAVVANMELVDTFFPSSGTVLHPVLALQGTGKHPISYLSVTVPSDLFPVILEVSSSFHWEEPLPEGCCKPWFAPAWHTCS